MLCGMPNMHHPKFKKNFRIVLKLVDEAWDESKMEQMTIILRFVDKDDFIQERFFHSVHVKDTIALTLKKKICDIISCYDLKIENI